MPSVVRRIISSFVLLCVVGLSAGDRVCARTPIATASVKTPAQLANRYPEVRLRRLYLARPDLIPYPIAYEVIC